MHPHQLSNRYASDMPLCYYILGAAIVACVGLRAWPSNKGQLVWVPLLFASMAIAIREKALLPVSLLPMSALAVCGITFQKIESKFFRNVVMSLGIIFALTLSIHKFPGFNNFKLLDGIALSPISKPITFYANFDKAFAGLMLYAFFLRSTKKPLYRSICSGVLGGSLSIFCVMVPAWLFGLVAIDVKGPGAPIIEFLVVNLLFVSMAEEVFFRGIIQGRVAQALPAKPSLNLVPLLISSVAFALAHIQGGTQIVVFAGVAGLCYAFIYKKTESIEAAIIAHWIVNAAHFVFFTYPGLK